MSLPTKSDINIHNSLDEISACEHFHNKSLEQAEAMFRESGAYYQEDLMWMGYKAFNFYLQAVINYLKSEDSVGDGHLISCMAALIAFRLEYEKKLLDIAKIKNLVEYVLANYEKYNVHEAYGDVFQEFQQLKTELN